MTGVSTVSATVANALTGVVLSVGESSLGRVVAGVDATAHNIMDGVVAPTTRRIMETRGYEYRNNGTPGPVPVLTTQQLQVTKTSLDPRTVRIQRDAVNLLTRACQASDALDRTHPVFEELGAVHMRLTLPVPTTAKLSGFVHFAKLKEVASTHAGSPSPKGGKTKESDTAQVADPHSTSDQTISTKRCNPLNLFGACCPRKNGPPRESPRPVSRHYAAVPGVPARVPLHRTGSESIRGSDNPFLIGGERLSQPEMCDISDDSSEDGDSEDASEVTSHPGTPLGALGNALKARDTIDMMRGVEKSKKVSVECNFCSWLTAGNAKGFVDKVLHIANPVGARDLYILDVIIPTELLTACLETADSLLGEERPAKNLHLQKAQRRLKRLVSNKVDQPTFNYLETITNLVTMALLLDSGETGKNHCNICAYSGVQPMFQDFFANMHLEDAMEDLDRAKKEAGHPVEGIVLSVPAPEMKGSLSEKLVMFETAAFGEYELTEKKSIVGAVQVGVDLMGKSPPNDHKSPLNFICAVYRHLGDSDTVVAEGTPFEYVVHLDRREKSKLSANHDRVWEDMIEDHCNDFIMLLTSREHRFDYNFFTDGKPNSYSTESYEKWLEEQIADESFYASDNAMCELLSNTKATMPHMQQLKATAQCKKGEDSSRARAVISPGVSGSEGLHQARTSPMIKALEALHAILYNHTNLKGLNEETKRIRFAEFLRAVPKGAIVFGTDKSKNDSCFREAVWKKCVKYLAKMNDIFEEQVMTRAYVYSPNEASASQSFPNGTLDMKYWIIKLTPLLAILLSGIGPTSFFNRLESTVENGTGVLDVYGDEAYAKWRLAERRAVASAHPAWSQHALPHVAEFVEWAPLAPHMVADTSVKYDKLEKDQIRTYHMGIYEGDDQAHAIIPPDTDGWKNLSVKDTVMHYTSRMSRATNFIFEAALTADEMDMVGRNSILEMLSAWIGLPSGRSDTYEVAVIVPKVLKAIRKLPHCTISSQHTIIYDATGEPIDVERNENFWSLALTKFFALAIINKESLGIRGLFLSHGDYCYEQLERLLGKQCAYNFGTIYGDRDPERREIEEAASTTFGYCGIMREHAHDVLEDVNKDRVLRTCCAAWRSELPELALDSKDKVGAALMAFDSITMTVEITDQHISDPMMLWEALDIGCLLEPLVMHATSNHKKVAAMFRSTKLLADSEETVQLARKYASTKPNGSANKDGRPDAAESQGRGKEKGDGKGKGKQGKGKGKGPADAKGDSKPSKPAASRW